VAYDAQLHGEDVTMASVTVLVLLVSFNLFCRAMAKWLVPRLSFGGRSTLPLRREKAMLQPIFMAVKRQGGPSLRQAVRSLLPGVKAARKWGRAIAIALKLARLLPDVTGMVE
jgi:hypothetical protein